MADALSRPMKAPPRYGLAGTSLPGGTRGLSLALLRVRALRASPYLLPCGVCRRGYAIGAS